MENTGAKMSSRGKQRILSQAEVEKLIQQEVSAATKRRDKELTDLIDTFHEMNNEVNFKVSIHKLQTRINTLTNRAEEAFDYMMSRERNSASPFFNAAAIKADPDGGITGMMSQDKNGSNWTSKNGELLKVMETTKNTLKRLQAHSKALMESMADETDEQFPPVLSPKASPEHKIWTKTEHTEEAISLHPNDRLQESDEPKCKKIKVESPDRSDDHKDKETLLYYPPLPVSPFPPVLSFEAASYSIPPKLEVNLALIRNPTRLSVLWNVAEQDPCAPPMESYTIFLTMEKEKGSGEFPPWRSYCKVEAKPLPMCALIKKYKMGHKVCAAVQGKDKFGRYGSFSKVVTVTSPE